MRFVFYFNLSFRWQIGIIRLTGRLPYVGVERFVLCRHFLLKSCRRNTWRSLLGQSSIGRISSLGLVRYCGTHFLVLLGLHVYLGPSGLQARFSGVTFSFFPVIFDFDIDWACIYYLGLVARSYDDLTQPTSLETPFVWPKVGMVIYWTFMLNFRGGCRLRVHGLGGNDLPKAWLCSRVLLRLVLWTFSMECYQGTCFALKSPLWDVFLVGNILLRKVIPLKESFCLTQEWYSDFSPSRGWYLGFTIKGVVQLIVFSFYPEKHRSDESWHHTI